RSPITERALVVLAAAQDGENIFELRRHFRLGETEIGFICQDEAAEGRARDLLAATVRKILQIGIESMRETKGKRGDRGRQLAELGIHLARDRNLDAVLVEGAAPNLSQKG